MVTWLCLPIPQKPVNWLTSYWLPVNQFLNIFILSSSQKLKKNYHMASVVTVAEDFRTLKISIESRKGTILTATRLT